MFHLKNANTGELLRGQAHEQLEDALRQAWLIATGDNYQRPSDCDAILIVDANGNDVDYVSWHDGGSYHSPEEFVKYRMWLMSED